MFIYANIIQLKLLSFQCKFITTGLYAIYVYELVSRITYCIVFYGKNSKLRKLIYYTVFKQFTIVITVIITPVWLTGYLTRVGRVRDS